MKTQPSSPAFPRSNTHYEQGHQGMTLRQYYAGQAMVGHLANETPANLICMRLQLNALGTAPECIARSSVSMADALIAELEKTEKPSPKITFNAPVEMDQKTGEAFIRIGDKVLNGLAGKRVNLIVEEV